MFNKQRSVVKIFWDNENINKLLYGGGILCVIYSIQVYPIFLVRILTKVWFTISPIYQRENFNEILIIQASIMVNIFIIENSSQIVQIEDDLMLYNSKLSKVSGY